MPEQLLSIPAQQQQAMITPMFRQVFRPLPQPLLRLGQCIGHFPLLHQVRNRSVALPGLLPWVAHRNNISLVLVDHINIQRAVVLVHGVADQCSIDPGKINENQHKARQQQPSGDDFAEHAGGRGTALHEQESEGAKHQIGPANPLDAPPQLQRIDGRAQAVVPDQNHQGGRHEQRKQKETNGRNFWNFCSNKPQHEQLHKNSADKFPGQLLPVFFFLHRGVIPETENAERRQRRDLERIAAHGQHDHRKNNQVEQRYVNEEAACGQPQPIRQRLGLQGKQEKPVQTLPEWGNGRRSCVN